jgi:hypothetical protein
MLIVGRWGDRVAGKLREREGDDDLSTCSLAELGGGHPLQMQARVTIATS